MVSFSHIIFYIADIGKALSFYDEVFGFKPKFIHESNEYAELSTGSTTIAFASKTLATLNLPEGYIPHDKNQLPLANEIVFTVSDVVLFYEKALTHGGLPVAAPQQKPWGQTVAYVRDPNGVLIEIASPLAAA